MKAKNVTGHLRAIYDAKAVEADYDNWHEFITELRLEDEDAIQCFLVLKDMIEGSSTKGES